MCEKKKLLEECIAVMKKPEVEEWYNEYLQGKPQYYTISTLEKAVLNKELTIKDALSLAFVVGIQWNYKFEGVP